VEESIEGMYTKTVLTFIQQFYKIEFNYIVNLSHGNLEKLNILCVSWL